MSHPNPSHDESNQYPEDKVTHYPKAKSKALHKTKGKKAAGKCEHCESARKSLRNESISYGELAHIQSHRKHILSRGDRELGEAAGIPEYKFK